MIKKKEKEKYSADTNPLHNIVLLKGLRSHL